VVEDTAFSRVLIANQLRSLNYEVLEAENGRQAWKMLKENDINMVVTDWMMPEMDGIELCEKIRKFLASSYIYIILLTAKKERQDFIQGMAAGADDFMSKPYDPMELEMKIRAGERVLSYERKLKDRNAELAVAMEELDQAYRVIKQNLNLAARFQKSLVPPKDEQVGPLSFHSFWQPCEIVAGDYFNYFPYSDRYVCFYLLDVAGHGIPAAMLSFTLSHVLSPLHESVPSLTSADTDVSASHLFLNFTDPQKVAQDLNHIFQDRSDGEQYFTMIYGVLDLKEQRIRFTQAGHPPMIHLPKNKEALPVGDGGFPMGLFNDVTFDSHEFEIGPGDRIFLYSDGITSVMNPQREPYSMHRFLDFLNKNREKNLDTLLNSLSYELDLWRGSEEFDDDLSILAFEYLPKT
jgi:sigma-B regulation protein RsbU (phosphoserine phosphatase)